MLRVTALTAVALALGVGVVRSPDLLLPGRSERDGIDLAARVSGPTGSADGDWFYDNRLSAVRVDGGSIRIESRAAGLQLISRSLAVHPGRCYVARAEIAATRGLSLAVTSDLADEVYRRTQIAPTEVSEPTSLSFVPESARITVRMFADGAGAFTLLRSGTMTLRRC